MPISWYPGHMHKASKELRSLLKQLHLIVEVLDARAPEASSNPVLMSLAPDLPRIRILNKADLADAAAVLAWQQHFDQNRNMRCLVNGKHSPLSTAALLHCAERLISEGGAGNTNIRLLALVGIPNAGKSTLINQFAGRKLARTGNEPAVTRGQQRAKLDDNWRLIDTPGLLWPKLEDQHKAYLLAMLGTIRNTAIDIEDVAWYAAEFLQSHYPQALQARYGDIGPGNPAEAVLEAVARSQGAIAQGGRPDWQRAAELLLNDLRSGKLGRLSLEQPGD